MRPPDCYVCHLTLSDVPGDGRDYFTLLRFGATEEAKVAPSRVMEAAGRTGHPYNAVWFCNEHLPLSRDYENRNVNEALDAIEADLSYTGRRRRHRPEGAASSDTSA